jgi:D-glycero-alpha-D-manno-heptose-7-phosphate kinase
MIISRTPVRIPLGGGGTDLPAYYEKYGGFVLTAAVNKYVYVTARRHFEETIRFSGYHRKEVASSIDEVQHPVVREALRLLNLGKGIEIVSLSDVPANVGLGTSSTFTVGLLCALHAYRGDHPSPQTLAQEALTIERHILKETGGVQDQYVAAYGGIISIDVNKQGNIAVAPLQVDQNIIEELEMKLLFFYTNIQRTAHKLQAGHSQAVSNGVEEVTESLHQIKRIGLEVEEAIRGNDLDRFGILLDEHWKCKNRIGKDISNSSIDSWYRMAKEAGALGGKLLGAGGGGFLMFYCQNGVKDRVRKLLVKEGLKEINFRFEPTGSRIILHI